MLNLKVALFILLSLAATNSLAAILMAIPHPIKMKEGEKVQDKAIKTYNLPADAAPGADAIIVAKIKTWTRGKYTARWLPGVPGQPKTIIINPVGKTIDKNEEAEPYFKVMRDTLDTNFPRRPKTPQRRWSQKHNSREELAQRFVNSEKGLTQVQGRKGRNKRAKATWTRRNNRQ